MNFSAAESRFPTTFIDQTNMAMAKVLLYLSVLGQICGLCLFFLGFMPINLRNLDVEVDGSRSSCHAKVHDGIKPHEKISTMGEENPSSTKLVLMVVDALREDFVFTGNRMPYTQKLIQQGKTLSFLAKSKPPTVTMPRIKAILTGAIPQFIDVVMNFASVELKQDNVVAKFNKKRKNIIFFGDDTWIKLLPNCFLRQEGTTSFVVSDFTEVDDNVTRHLNEELSRFDWDVMILHFLGLDHIGHTFGPYNSLIDPKLLEMDQVIGKIVESLAERNRRYSEKSLFVLTSDHGMNDAGGHGGSTTAETITPLVFASSHSLQGQGKPFTGKIVNQIDIAATISSFFDLAIPVQSVGALIGDLLEFHPIEVQKQKMKENICQLAEQTGHITFNSATAGSILQCCNRTTECLKNTSLVDLNRLLQEQSAFLQAQFSGYHPENMFLGIALLFFSFVLSWWQWFIPILSSFPKPFRSGLYYWLLFAVAVHSLSMASTSYIEEEHQLWYFVLTTSMLILLLSGTTNIHKTHTIFREGFKCFYFLLLLRIMRGWNQTGVKWLGQKDIAHLLRANESKLYILILIFISLMSIYYVYFWSVRTLGNVLNAVGLILVLFNKSIGLLQWQHLFVNEKTAARLVFAVSFFIGIRPMAQLTFMKVAGKRRKEYVESPQERKRLLDQRVKYILKNSLDWLRLQVDVRAWLQSKSTSKQDLTEGECYRAEQGHLHALLLIYLLVLRPHNLVWMGIVAAVETTLSAIVKNRFNADYDVPFIMTNFVFARACFHAQGLSNALSSIDVSTGLTGFNHYSPVFAGLLVSIATYGIHIFWVNALACHIARSQSKNSFTWKIRSTYNAILSLENFVFCVVIYGCRYHTFIWTVFAPKFLFITTRYIFITTLVWIL